jgi:hypothetical protein
MLVSCASKKSIDYKDLDIISLEAYHLNYPDFKKINSSVLNKTTKIFVDDKKISNKNHQKVLDTISSDHYNLIVLKEQNIIKFIRK